MAPEIILGGGYSFNVDIWSLGVIVMEMAEGDPPYMDHAPLKAMFIIGKQGMPPLRYPDSWSPEMRDFLGLCLNCNPLERPEAKQLLRHPFLTTAGDSEAIQSLLLDVKAAQQRLELELGDLSSDFKALDDLF